MPDATKRTKTVPTVYYMCKYTPLELFAGLGVECVRLEPNTDGFTVADALGHPNLCGYGKGILEAVVQGGIKEVVLVNCCDVVRRVYDILKMQGGLDFLYLLDLPHGSAPADINRMESQLRALKTAYQEYGGANANLEPLVSSSDGDAVSAEYSTSSSEEDRCLRTGRREPRHLVSEANLVPLGSSSERERPAAGVCPPTDEGIRINVDAVADEQGPYISLMGAHSGAFLPELVRQHMPLPVRDDTCVGNRNVHWPQHEACKDGCCPGADGTPQSAAPITDEQLHAYAEALLKQTPCMRMLDVAERKALGRNAAGILYHTMKFCDYYGFEYAGLSRTTTVPLVKIETDGTRQSEGQLATRLDALAESLSLPKKENTTMRTKIYTAGIDSGSTSTDAVILSPEGELVGWAIVPTGAGAAGGAQKAMEAALQMAGLSREEIGRVVTTGYGRDSVGVDGNSVTEITCHARGAHYLDPAVRTVIDIGGQDSKIIRLDENGAVTNFVMNDKCAAGTGRFLEMMARTMELSLEEMSERGLSWKKEVAISSMCTVFAESEVVSLIARNEEVNDIIHGLNESIASRTLALLKRLGEEGAYMMTGGVAQNRGVVKVLEDHLGQKVLVSEHAQLCGAIGAALLAGEETEFSKL